MARQGNDRDLEYGLRAREQEERIKRCAKRHGEIESPSAARSHLRGSILDANKRLGR